jgi:hypothetical protein
MKNVEQKLKKFNQELKSEIKKGVNNYVMIYNDKSWKFSKTLDRSARYYCELESLVGMSDELINHYNAEIFMCSPTIVECNC